jgi:hypothetical protein
MEIKYDGKWPNLCNGTLEVKLSDKTYFIKGLRSGGSAGVDSSSHDYCYQGCWTIEDDKWPSDFPEEKKEELIQLINDQITLGCCGGCI